MINLNCEDSTVTIDKGELVSFKNRGHEFIHQKGSPGWRNADTEMFPIIGPVNEAGFRVEVPKGNAVQDQHGLLRELNYDLMDSTETRVTFKKKYKAETPIKNSKFPDKSIEEWLTWPYSFDFEKTFELSHNQLEITFKIFGEQNMPFMLGYHPAFKLYTSNPLISSDQKEITLDDVLMAGSRAFQVKNCEAVTLKDQKEIKIITEGFGHFMCWTEVPNMVCIEPISFYPYAVEQGELHKGFQQLSEKEVTFKTVLKV